MIFVSAIPISANIDRFAEREQEKVKKTDGGIGFKEIFDTEVERLQNENHKNQN